MERFNKKEAEQLVKSICETQIKTFGNILYKTFDYDRSVCGPMEVHKFCEYVSKELQKYYGDKHLYKNPFCNFTVSQNLIPLFIKYGIKINPVVNHIVIDSDTIDDITLYYKYGICRYGFKETIETYNSYINNQK